GLGPVVRSPPVFVPAFVGGPRRAVVPVAVIRPRSATVVAAVTGFTAIPAAIGSAVAALVSRVATSVVVAAVVSGGATSVAGAAAVDVVPIGDPIEAAVVAALVLVSLVGVGGPRAEEQAVRRLVVEQLVEGRRAEADGGVPPSVGAGGCRG